MLLAPIGGQKLVGGWVSQADARAAMQNQSPFEFPGSYPQRQIPVRDCQLLEIWDERPLRLAGMMGAAASRRISFGAYFSFSIIQDSAGTPEVDEGGAPAFRQRDPFQLSFQIGYDFIADISQRAYYAPRAVGQRFTSIWDHAIMPRKPVGLRVEGVIRTHVFILPQDGDPSDAATLVGAYCQYLRTNGGVQ